MAVVLVLLAWLLLAGVVVQTIRLSTIWRRGAPAKVGWIGGLLAMPRRYLVDVHAIVERRAGAARMHQAIAGGLLAGSALLLLGIFPALRTATIYWGLVTLAFALAVAGVALVAMRRLPSRPAALSGGAFLLLPLYLSAYAAGGLLAALGILAGAHWLGTIGLLLVAFGGAMLVAGISTGPMRHAVAGALHLAAHPRSGRFAGDAASGLLPLPEKKFGAARIEDFPWNRLLGFDACIQCGRCEEACPAFASGQPLNPKALIQDFCAAMRPGVAPSYAGSPHPALSGAGPILGTIHPESLWSCTTCRACVASCPMMIEHVDAVIDLRRDLTLSHGAAPGKADAVLAELRHTGNSGGFAPERRLDFAAGAKLRVLAEGEAADTLLWLGDGAFDRRYGQTLRALVAIMAAAGLDFAVLGADELDCGDLARRLGDEAGFTALARANIATLATRRFARIVTADPHALHVLRREYPAFGGRYEVMHHTALIDELLTGGSIALAAPGATAITYHDPCYLGRYNGETEAPRRILARLTSGGVEMARHGKTSFCCGGGGGAPVTDIPGERRIPDLRMEQASATGATIVAVACPGCTSMLEGVVEPRPMVRDIAELVREAMVLPARAAVPA
jgi:dimethylglycine catabolism B